MPIEKLIKLYNELVVEVYDYSPDKDSIPVMGKRRSLEGLKPKNVRAYRKLHIVDTKIWHLNEEIEQILNEMYDWRACYEKTK